MDEETEERLRRIWRKLDALQLLVDEILDELQTRRYPAPIAIAVAV
jgi:hypothetical protein